MRGRIFTVFATIAIVLVACQQGGGGGGGGGDGTGRTVDPESIPEGTEVVLSGWQASPEEGELLEQMFGAFEAMYPNIGIDYQPVSGDYVAARTADFSAGTPPDVFYVDWLPAAEWIEEGFLEPLDPYIEGSDFDTSAFYEGYLDIFRGPDGQIYGLPKDASPLVLFYNTSMLDEAGVEVPTNWEELTAAAQALSTDEVAGICLSPSLDRALAFIYQNGGAIYNEDYTEVVFDSPESREAIDYYLQFFKDGTGRTPAQIGAGWCGEAFTTGQAAMAIEGNWLVPLSEESGIEYAMAELPQGAQQATLGFTAAYAIGVDSENKDAGWLLIEYLTGPEGMATWTSAGLALPSRSDVPPPEGRDALVASAEYARGVASIPGFADVNNAFNNALSAAIEEDGSSEDVVPPTVAAAEETIAE